MDKKLKVFENLEQMSILVPAAEKEAIRFEEREKFKKIVAEASHGIRSSLSALSMTIKSHHDELPESINKTISSAITSVESIIYRLVAKCEK